MIASMFVLFFWFDTGYRATPVVQEFSSSEACYAALKQFKEKGGRSADGFCTRK